MIKSTGTAALLELRRFGTVEVIQINDSGEEVPLKQTLFVTFRVNDDVWETDFQAQKETVEKRKIVKSTEPVQTMYIIRNPCISLLCFDRD